MASRRPLIGLVLLAGVLHVFGMWREPLPAQDGLKFFRIARQFQTMHWTDAVRKSDQHPLYPAIISVTEPLVGQVIGQGPTAWRISGQLVSMFAAMALLIPLHGLTRSLFDERTATLAVFLFLILPLTCELGHDTLSDMTALLAFVISIRLGELALRQSLLPASIGCGLAAGIGYLTRPEVAIVPVAVLLTAALQFGAKVRDRRNDESALTPLWDHAASLRLGGLSLALLATVGSYAVVKGEVSEKLALRLGAGMKASAPPKIVRSDSRDGLDDPRFHFDAKEESNEGLSSAPLLATATLLYRWAGLLGYILVPLAVYGAVFGRAGPGKILVAVYLIVFTVIVVRHSTTLGYLSGRHTLTLVTLTLPWTAAGYITATRHLALWRGWDPVGVPRRRAFCALLALVIGTSIQIYKPGHPSRWGHLAAGRWLARNTTPSDRVLDTRGWARFVADRPGYDYWHVKQALNDPNLAYVVVGRDEFEADSPRGATLRAILAYAGQAEVDFPSRRGGHDKSVRIFRYQSPETWEGLSL